MKGFFIVPRIFGTPPNSLPAPAASVPPCFSPFVPSMIPFSFAAAASRALVCLLPHVVLSCLLTGGYRDNARPNSMARSGPAALPGPTEARVDAVGRALQGFGTLEICLSKRPQAGRIVNAAGGGRPREVIWEMSGNMCRPSERRLRGRQSTPGLRCRWCRSW